MPIATHPGETDLIVPLPGDDDHWDPHTIHTHYFGFSVPEAELGAFLYLRYQPAFPLSQGGVALFRGMDNVHALDMEFLDYEITMPYPEISGNTITTANGLRIEFTEPGRAATVSYRSRDGSTSFELQQTAVTPLFARGHIMPGEDDHADPARQPGGSEQYMHCVGEVTIRGETFSVDCYAPRDRSWRQVRTEDQGGARRMPPIGWSPMYFGEDLIFNQVSFEPADTDPAWSGLFELPEGAPTHHYAWVYSNGEVREITRVRRNVLAYHPRTHVAIRQEIEAEDEAGQIYRFTGEAIATATVPCWPNAAFNDTVYRWEDETGRVSHGTYQELWNDDYQRAMNERAHRGAAAA
jgi:hypothetical protein